MAFGSSKQMSLSTRNVRVNETTFEVIFKWLKDMLAKQQPFSKLILVERLLQLKTKHAKKNVKYVLIHLVPS